MQPKQVVIIGAGVGGLTAAIDLVSNGIAVSVIETASAPGGKMRGIMVDGATIDAGPTVFTMREVFEELFDDAGASFSDYVSLQPLQILARHAWSEKERLDLFADIEASADAIGSFAGAAAAKGFLQFAARSREIFQTLERAFIRAQRPSPIRLVTGTGLSGLGDLWRISPFSTMWQALESYFPDPRLRQLFARYATYCGSSPFEAPATLMLVAHAEQKGVWTVKGGMRNLAMALERLAKENGAIFRYETRVKEILVSNGRAIGVALESGERIRADAVVHNGDVAALTAKCLGYEVEHAVSASSIAARSLSAVTWLLHAETEGFPLLRHSVFFSNDYAAEFDAIFRAERLPANPTIYVCAQDRDEGAEHVPKGRERLMCLVNAPPHGDRNPLSPSEVERCRNRTFRHLERCGLRVSMSACETVTPTDFNRLYPGTGGALYGRASHGWTASFQRPGSRSRMPGLYLAGGSTHPGPGVPMAAISGRLAAQAVLSDLASIGRFHPAAMPGGMSTR